MVVAEAEPRGRMLRVRAGPDVHRWLDDAAERTGLTRSELVRLIIRRAAEEGLSADVVAAANAATAIKTARAAGSRSTRGSS